MSAVITGIDARDRRAGDVPRTAGGLLFGAGHESAAIAEPARALVLRRGRDGAYFDLFILVANPGADAGAACGPPTSCPTAARSTSEFPVAPQSRFNIWVDCEDAQLADTAVSTVIESLNGVPSSPSARCGGRERAGRRRTTLPAARRRARVGDRRRRTRRSAQPDTYVLIANTSETTAWVDRDA